jgi:hypothetical protein
MSQLTKLGRKLLALLRRAGLDEDGQLRPWTVPAALLVVAFLAYGLYARHLGFYWDDWTFAWARFFRGLAGLKDTFDINRPIRAYFEAPLGTVLGVNPLAWQILALLLRWAAAVSLWWFLRLLWPRATYTAFMVSLFYLVYPGFSQQSLAMTYQYFWFFQAVFFVSLGLAVWGIRTPRVLFPAMAAAFLLATVQLFSSEYLIGLELLRPLILWIALGTVVSDPGRRLGRTALYSLPFLIALGIYFYWRVFVFKFPSYQPVLLETLRSSPLQGALGLVNTALVAFERVTLGAWLRVVQVPLYQLRNTRFAILYPVLVVVSLGGLFLYQNLQPRSNKTGRFTERWKQAQLWQMLLVGVLATFLAGLPFYISGLQVNMVFESDRLSMSFMFGAGLLLATLVELFFDHPQRVALASGLAALAIGAQLYYAFLFRNESELQQAFAWQLTWRAPALEPGTLILSDDQTFPYTDDQALAFLVNWIYAPGNHSQQFAYAYNTLSDRLGNQLPSLDPHVPVRQDFYASAVFQGSTDHVLVLYFAPPSCLRIMNPVEDANLIFQSVWWLSDAQPTVREVYTLPPLGEKALPLSNLDQIVATPNQAAKPPAAIFGREPQHTWCYYFEKADLARQSGDWEQVARIGQEAMVANSLRPADLSEYLAFIEADAHLGRWQEAQDLSQKLGDWAPVLKPSLCALWQRAAGSQAASGGESAIAAVKQYLQCPQAP